LKWARQGVVATVKNGEVIQVIQARVADASFQNLHIIPMGADKVFIHSLTTEDVMINFNGARQFFYHLFSSIMRWDNEILPIQRGVWVCLYGIPLNAWNMEFFKLYVLDYDRLLCMHDISLERDKFDYARVLIVTSSLEVLNRTIFLLVDDTLMEIKVIKESGFNIGEDTCLYEEGVTHEESPEVEQEYSEDEHVEVLVEKLAGTIT
jgi:hypothetical protein